MALRTAAMSLVRRTAATQMTVSSASERGWGITAGGRTNFCTVAGYKVVVIMICCMLVGLLLVWRKPRCVAVATSRGTRTMDDDVEQCHTSLPPKVMIANYGEAAHGKQDCPFFLESHTIRTLSWFVTATETMLRHCPIGGGVHWDTRTGFQPQSVFYKLQNS